MPLDAARANTMTETIKAAFDAIGTENATRMPPSKSNTEPFAWEYHCASLLLRFSETRRERAQKAAVKAGVMFDHTKSPLPVGTNKLVYGGDVIEISVSVAAPMVKFDEEAFIAELLKAGVSASLVKRLRAKHTKPFNPPHRFTTSLATA